MRKHLALALLLAMASAAHAQNLQSVGIVNGVPQSGTGTVSTLDGVITNSLGATGDAAATAGSTGTLSAKIRLMTSQLNSISSILGSPFQAGGSIGNTTFAVTQATGTNLHMVCDSGCSSSSAPADAATFTFSTTSQTPIGGVFQTTATSNPLTTGQMGAWQFTANRAGFVNLRNSSGTEMATAAAPLVATGSGTAGSPAAGVLSVQGVTSMTALKVDGSAVTQPVSGTVTANAGTNLNTSLLALETGGNLATVATNTANLNLSQASTTSGQKGNLILGATTTSAPTYTTAQSNPLSLTTAGALRTDASATTQPVSAASLPLPTGAATSSNQTTANTSLSTIATNSGTQATAANQTTANTSLSTIATNSGTQATAANQSSIIGTKAAGTAAASSALIGGVFNTSLPTLTTGQQAAAQFDSSGRLIVNIGAGASSGAVAQGSTTSGQTGSLVQCAVTTSAPTYTTAQTSPVSCDTSGATRVNVTNNGVAQAATTSGTTISPVGGGASTSEPTAVTDGQIARALMSVTGKAINLPYAVPENTLNGQISTAMTGTTSTAVSGMGAQGSGIRNYITACTFSNTHATVGTMINLQDGSGGTVIWQVPAGPAYAGAAVVFPTPIKTTANTALFAVNATTGASTFVSCTGYKGV